MILQDTLEAVVTNPPNPVTQQKQHLCMDKGYSGAPADATARVFGYQPHCKQIGQEKLDARKRKRAGITRMLQPCLGDVEPTHVDAAPHHARKGNQRRANNGKGVTAHIAGQPAQKTARGGDRRQRSPAPGCCILLPLVCVRHDGAPFPIGL